MQKVLIVLVLLLAVVIGLGFYLGWFGFSTSRDPETGKSGVQFNIDQNKIKSDAQRARERVTGSGSTNQTKEQSGGH
jgi:hypothetical protein